VVALGLAHEGGRDPLLPPLVERSGTSPFVLLVAAYRLRQHLRQRPPHVVMAHGGWAAEVTVLAIPRGGPLVVWQRILGFPVSRWGPMRRRWWRAVADRVDAAVALTDDLEQELRQLGFDGPIWVIPNSRRPDRFVHLDREVEARRLREDLGLADGAPLLGFVGHLVVQKRAERTVDVLAKVRAAGVDAHLVVAGDGPQRRRLEAAVRDLGLGQHVTLLGHRDDVEHILAAVDVCLLTSDAEGIPGVAIEAQMAGTPIVTFPMGGVREVVEDGVTGVVLPQSDTAVMADAVVSLLHDPERRLAMGVEARRRTPDFAASRAAVRYAAELVELERARRSAARSVAST
jgi:glycosyltransferase involved in cell wall biosynthesis